MPLAPTGAQLRSPRDAWQLPLFFAGNVCLAAGLFVHAFLFNFYLREMRLTATAMGYQASAITLGGLAALLPAGRAIDRFGVRPVLLGGVVLTTSGLVLTALARSITVIYPTAVLIGLGGATCRVTWGPALMRLTSERNRTRAFTWNVALLVGTGGAWTLLAGALPAWSTRLAERGGLSGTQLTLLAGAAVSALAWPCYQLLRVENVPVRERSSWSVAVPENVRSLVPLVAFWMLATALVLPFFNVFFQERFEMSMARIGAIFAAAQIVHALVLVVAADLAHRWGARRALLAWAIVLAPILWLLALTGTPSIAVVLFVLQGLIAPATNPLIDQLLLERVPEKRQGVTAGWRNAATEGAGALGASAGGRLLDATSYAALFAVAGAVAMASCALLGLALRPRRVTASAGAPGAEAA